MSGNAVNFKATNDHTAIYVEDVREGAHILCFRLIKAGVGGGGRGGVMFIWSPIPSPPR